MKVTAHIAITAVVILAAAAGVLFPLRANIEQSQRDVEVLESERLHDASTSVKLEDVKRQIAEFRQQHEGRNYDLCPDTPAARSTFEQSLVAKMREVGLRRVSMDSQAGVKIGEAPAFVISLVVEGQPHQMHELLLGLEDMRWLTRVLEIDVKSGGESRRTSMEIAVLLEEPQV